MVRVIVAPSSIIGISIIMVIRIGWLSLVGISCLAFISVLQYLIAKLNSRCLENLG